MNTAPRAWEVDVPLVTNPNMVGAWLKAMGATWLLAMLVLGTLSIGTGEPEALPVLAGIFALVTAGIAVFGLLIMLVLFGNRFRARFRVDETGVSYEGLDRRARALARIAMVAGAAAGSARTSGAGLLAISGEQLALPWSVIAEARAQPRRRCIVLRNRWRDLMHLYCTPENYEAVAAEIAARVPAVEKSGGVARRPSPLPSALLHTGLVVLATLPLFALQDITGLDVFVPLLVLLFALTTVWLVPLFGWVVLLLSACLLVHQIVALCALREYTLVNSYSYRVFEALDEGEWVVVLAAVLGLAWLAGLSWRAVHGRFVPVLMRDQIGV